MSVKPTVSFRKFEGMDNIHGDAELPTSVLRRAINVDVTDFGVLRRRKGSTSILAVSGAHSLWGDGRAAYFVLNNRLRQFYPNGTSTDLGAFVAYDNPASYVRVDEDIYITSKTARARLRGFTLNTWGLDVPVTAPVLGSTVGTLPAGRYFGAVTYLMADGRESGASAIGSVELLTDGGIATTAMPIPTDALVTKKRLYISAANGEVLYMAAEVAPAIQFVSIGSGASGAVLRTAHLSPPPLGRALAHVNGRIFIVDAADPKILWHTESLDYDHVDTRKNYYQFGADITVIAPTTDGLYVCADRTFFIDKAGTKDASRKLVLDFGAILGSAASIPNTAESMWMTSRGPAIGKEGGAVELIAEKRIAVGEMDNVASLIREQDGLRQFVVVGSTTQDSALQAGSYADAEIVRRST